MIEMVGVSKAYGNRQAVRGATATFPAGTVTCLLGLNGAGKTTLLRLIAGLDTADAGTVLVAGQRLRHHADPMRLLGMQIDAMDPQHTVRRHLRWLAALGGIDTARVGSVLAQVGLADHRSERIANLSTGARQRLSIAGALLGNPQVYLFDEPHNGLDVPGIVWLRHLLRALATDGRTVVLASHLLSEVVLIADRVMVLADGAITADGTVDTVVPGGDDPREHLEHALIGGGR